MSHIVAVSATVKRLENKTLSTSYGSGITAREHVFVAVKSDDGTTGYAEGSPLPHFSGERAPEMQLVIENVLGPAMIGLDTFNFEALHQALNKALAHNKASKAALVNAVYDLQGKLSGQPVVQLLGGKLNERIPLAGAVGIEDIPTVLERARSLFDAGTRTLKFKVGANVQRDLNAIRAVRDEFGSELNLRADANGGYTLAEAKQFLSGVSDLGLQYFEQPLPAGNLDGLAHLRGLGNTPIAVDESLFSVSDALEVVRRGAADVFIIKLIKLGGLYNARKVAAIAEAANITCVCVSPYETDLGGSANVHLAAASPAFRFAAELGVGVSRVTAPGLSKMQLSDGFALTPTTPGLGIDVANGFFD